MTEKFLWQAKVRDYELDALGVVNHANFINYFEAARHEHLQQCGLDLHELFATGYALVVAELTISYHRSLRAQDEFYITVNYTSYDEKRINIEQELFFNKNNKLAAKISVKAACVDLNTKRACMPDILRNKLSQMLGE